MNKILFAIFIFLGFYTDALAQKKASKKEEFKPAVLVVGNSAAAISAAVQSARSGVQTAILLQAGGFDLSDPRKDLPSGFRTTFVSKYVERDQKTGKKDGIFDKQLANATMASIADTLQKLKVLRNITWAKADRSGNNWSFRLADGSTIRPKVLVMGVDQRLEEALKITRPAPVSWSTLAYGNTLYRTSVASGKSIDGATATFFSLRQLLPKDQENLVWLSDTASMGLGQAAGATAAYAAFYGTKTSESNLKKIQGELIHFKLNQIPFFDVAPSDTNWKAIQFVGLTGVMKGKFDNGKLFFQPNAVVTTAEIRQPIKDYYYKAQLWFDDFKKEKLTIADALDMIAYVGNKSLEQMKREIGKNWKGSYGFATDFDLKREITRRELAVLLQDYMPPFNVNIDDNGKVVR